MTYTVVFAANNSYIQHFSVALASLLHNNKRVPFAISLRFSLGIFSSSLSIIAKPFFLVSSLA